MEHYNNTSNMEADILIHGAVYVINNANISLGAIRWFIERFKGPSTPSSVTN